MTNTITINIGNHRISILLAYKRLQGKTINGFTNRTLDGKYIICIDYDKIKLEWITYELERIQKEHKLSTFHIFKSNTNNYHAICFDKVTYHQLINILSQTTTDPDYLNIGRRHGLKIWVLRTTPKEQPITYIGYVPNESDNTKSLAHIELITKLYPQTKKYINTNKTDTYHKAIIARYQI